MINRTLTRSGAAYEFAELMATALADHGLVDAVLEGDEVKDEVAVRVGAALALVSTSEALMRKVVTDAAAKQKAIQPAPPKKPAPSKAPKLVSLRLGASVAQTSSTGLEQAKAVLASLLEVAAEEQQRKFRKMAPAPPSCLVAVA